MLPNTEAPFSQYFDFDGDPLDKGSIYYGLPNTNPVTSPIQVFWDSAGVTPAPQPIKTLNGYPVRYGTPANVFINQPYSISVYDKKGRLIYTIPNSMEFDNFQKLTDQTDTNNGASFVGYKLNATNSAGRTVTSKLNETISVLDFFANGVSGARVDPTGVLDSTAGIQAAVVAAINRGTGVARVPAGTYKVSATINVGGSGVCLKGDGIGVSILKASTASDPVITLTAGSNRLVISDISLDSSVVRTSGGYGIYSPGVVSNCTLTNIQSTNQYNGFQLGATDSSLMQHCFSQRNYNSGIALVTVNVTGSGGGCQWTMQNIVSELNDNHGIEIQAAPYTGVTQMTLGGLSDVNIFGNTGYGIVVIGQAGCPIYGFRVNGMFSGQNGKESLYLNTYGNQHNISNFYIELDGTQATGRTFSTPASHNARGVILTANNSTMRMASGLIKGSSLGGVVNSCSERLLFNDVAIEDSGLAAANVGFYHNTPGGRLVMTGCASGNTGVGASQTVGLYADDGATVTAMGCDFSNNTSSGFSAAINFSRLNIVGCFPTSQGNLLVGGVVLTGATGGNKGEGTLNVASNIYKNNVAYGNP